MCGIVGVYPKTELERTEKMLSMILHRGPDGHGIFNSGYGVIGHSRLAILDPEHGSQPFTYGESAISFNGEVYNYRELAEHYLPSIKFTTHSDTEVILRLFLELGPSMVPLLDGMFAFAILSGGNLFVARDPLGIKPLYYSEFEGSFYFSSEIRPLASVCPTVKEFPNGFWYDSRSHWHRYYRLEDTIIPFAGTEPEAIVQIKKITVDAVRKRLLADVPVGVSLSGGLDSSIVTVCARMYLDELNTFAVGMKESGDLEAARIIASREGTRHHERMYSESDMLAVLPGVIASAETFDPALVRSSVANWFLADLTSQTVKVMLTGEGADEIYAGYDYMARIQNGEDLQQELIHTTEALHNTNLQRADRLSMAFGLEARVPFLDTASIAFALGLPIEWKRHDKRISKYLLRQAFKDMLPPSIYNRPKMKFSAGAGSSHIFLDLAESEVTEADYIRESKRLKSEWNFEVTGKESIYYYRILRESITDDIIFPLMASSRSL